VKRLVLGLALVTASPSAASAQTVERLCARRMSVEESVAAVSKRREQGRRAPGQSLALCNGGVLNSLAVSRPEPEYPARARAAGVSGTVSLRVCLDEEGKVYALAACRGHRLLLAAAVRAAYRSRFRPVLSGGRPTRSNGILTYRFGGE
jgi:TonB family protein